MSPSVATLFLLCGKIAAGKSTLAKELAARHDAVLLIEDDWLSKLYPGELSSIDDYVEYSSRLHTILAPHITAILNVGTSVVMDFPANTIKQRKRLFGIAQDSGARHELHFLDVPDDTCLARLQNRNKKENPDFVVSQQEFELFTSYFVAPTEAEGFHIIHHPA